MTPEQEWLGRVGSGRLLQLSKRCTHLRPAVKARKYRLIAVAIARLFPVIDQQSELVSVIEHTEQGAEVRKPPHRPDPFPQPSLDFGDPLRVLVGLLQTDPYYSATQVTSAVRFAEFRPSTSGNVPLPSPDLPIFGDIVRDVFGNPFRPVAFDPAWRTSTAVGLAHAMYESRDFAAMPVLADGLEEAGCDTADVLAHCRGDGPHVRGCWVVDHVLRKA